MCELLIRVVDKEIDPINQKLNAQRTMAGDVITIREDNWPWSKEERSAPYWRILVIPGAPISDYEHLLEGDDVSIVEFARRRIVRIDVKNPEIAMIIAQKRPTAVEIDSVKDDPVKSDIIGKDVTDAGVLQVAITEKVSLIDRVIG